MALTISEFDAGRYASSLRALQRLETIGFGRNEVAYRIGLCERAIGRFPEALRAWQRVPLDETFGPEAAVARGTLLVDMLRFRPAEELLERTVRRAPSNAARRALVRLYRLECRPKDVHRVLEEGWRSAEHPADELNELWFLDTAPWPIAALQKIMANARYEDDRVWLARANLATMTGDFAAARTALDVCLRERPDDPAVRDAQLALGRRTQDAAAVRDALHHLSASRFSADDELEFRAWWARQEPDRTRERHAIEALLARRPSDSNAWERLAELALESGDTARAAECRNRKQELDERKERYRAILNEPHPIDRAAELATLAAALGRDFDAHAWSLLSAQHPSQGRHTETRPSLEPASPTQPAGMLADRLADVLQTRRPRSEPPRREPPPTPPAFTDDAASAGLDFYQDNGARGSFYLPEIMAGGVGLVDYDGDGWLDVYAVQGGPFPPGADAPSPGDRLFHNRGDGTFEDATERTGLARLPRGYGHAVAVGDFDNDGRPDVFVTRWRAYALYHNRGDGTFEDATETAGLGGDRDWPTSAAWADLDNDGDLDLYVCHYFRFDPANAPVCTDTQRPSVRVYCDPTRFETSPDHVFRNDGGRFVDVSASAGIDDPNGRSLGVLATDFDDDGRVDLFVTNDMTANYFFRNLGGFRFEEVAHQAGVASNAEGGYHAGMGIAYGDLDGDGRADLFVTNAYNEATTYYRSFGPGVFTDHTYASGLGLATRFLVGFGVALLDYDNDGQLDLISANGNLNDARPYNPYPMPVQLLAGRRGGRMTDVSCGLGHPWSTPRLGRGLAVGDLDNDGRTDALVMSLNEPLVYFHNRTEGGRALVLRLEGKRSNRDAIGARVRVRAGDRTWTAQRFGGGSYQSASDPRLVFGLGADLGAETVEVHWPSGQMNCYRDLAAGNEYRLREGDAAPAEVRPARR